MRRENLGQLALCGALAGMAPDLDVFISSATDPLLFLEFHRQFTHALVFIPVGALLVTGLLFPFMRSAMSFKHVYIACLLGYATHGLLDACTSYGTQLFWPFTDYRVAWNNVSVVDPAFTLPLLTAVVAGAIWQRRWIPWLGLLWVVCYLSVGLVQSQRAYAAGVELAVLRDHEPQRMTIKPSFGNLLVWKVIYEYKGRFFVDAVRVGLGNEATVCGTGSQAEVLDVDTHLAWLEESQQRTDLDRFSWFSQGYVAMDSQVANRVIDVRYSTVPNQVAALWSIDLVPSAERLGHVDFVTTRQFDGDQMALFRSFLTAANCKPLSYRTN